MDELKMQIACNAATYALDNWGRRLTDRQKRTLYRRYYDSVLAALMTYEETDTARKVRARALISEN